MARLSSSRFGGGLPGRVRPRNPPTRDEVDDVQVATADYAGAAKGEIVQADGFAKALADAETGEILGFHAVGPDAAELVHEVVVAMTAGDGTVDNVTDAIRVHPTLSELVHTVFGQLA